MFVGCGGGSGSVGRMVGGGSVGRVVGGGAVVAIGGCEVGVAGTLVRVERSGGIGVLAGSGGSSSRSGGRRVLMGIRKTGPTGVRDAKLSPVTGTSGQACRATGYCRQLVGSEQTFNKKDVC